MKPQYDMLLTRCGDFDFMETSRINLPYMYNQYSTK